MSKTKSLNKKTTGFDIMYRVVTAIMAVIIYPIFYFVDFFMIEIAHSDISNLVNKFNDSNTLYTTYEKVSVRELPQWIDFFSSFTNEDFDFKTSVLQNELYRPVFVAVVFLAIALVLGLVILVFAAFSNKIKVITALSGAGFLCTLASYISFTGFFAEPILKGDVSLIDLLNTDGFVVNLILQYLGEVEVFALCGSFFAVMFLLLGICAWSVSVMVVNASEEKEKQMKASTKKK